MFVTSLASFSLPPPTKLRQGNTFSSVCQEFCSQVGEVPGQVPPRQVYLPWECTPAGQVPPGQVHPQAGTPPWAGTPPGRYTPRSGIPQAGTPPGRYTLWAGTSRPGRYTLMVIELAVRILLECILVGLYFQSYFEQRILSMAIGSSYTSVSFKGD